MVMTRLFTLAALGTLLALPAAAQQSAFHTGGCETHSNDQVRCAVRMPMVGHYNQRVVLRASGTGLVSGQAQVWVGECGQIGMAGGIRDVRNSGSATELVRARVSAAAFSCQEVFVFNCREGGQRVPCSRGFSNATIRVDLTQ